MSTFGTPDAPVSSEGCANTRRSSERTPGKDKLLYRIPEACQFLGLSRSKVYMLIASGELPSVKIDGARRLRASDLRDYVASLQTAS
jgi:excisionase family DNA binding protein